MVGLSVSNDPLLRPLADRFQRPLFFDRWPIGIQRSLFHDRLPIGIRRSLYTIVGFNNDRSFFTILTDRNLKIAFVERCPMGIQRSILTIVGRPFLSIPIFRWLADSFCRPRFYDRWRIGIQGLLFDNR